MPLSACTTWDLRLAARSAATSISRRLWPAASTVNVPFSLGNLLVPDNLIFLVSIANQSAGVDIVGLDMFEPPGPGSSDPSFAIANNGSSFVQAPTTNEDVFFQLQASAPAATPEPVTAGIAGAGLLGLMLLRRRR